jgi:hypothetical protein
LSCATSARHHFFVDLLAVFFFAGLAPLAAFFGALRLGVDFLPVF